jgi:hypothetical protein
MRSQCCSLYNLKVPANLEQESLLRLSNLRDLRGVRFEFSRNFNDAGLAHPGGSKGCRPSRSMGFGCAPTSGDPAVIAANNSRRPV